MSHKVKVKLADDTVVDFTLGVDHKIPPKLGLSVVEKEVLVQITNRLMNLTKRKKWKGVEIGYDEEPSTESVEEEKELVVPEPKAKKIEPETPSAPVESKESKSE